MTIETDNATYQTTRRQLMITATDGGSYMITINAAAIPLGRDGQPLPGPGVSQEVSVSLTELPPALATAWAWEPEEPEKRTEAKLREALAPRLRAQEPADTIGQEKT